MPNILRLQTTDTVYANVFLVRWSTGNDTKGAVHVNVAGQTEDGRIIAELAAARWLLEDRNVCGHDKTGAGLIVRFSAGQVRKLQRGMSSKTHLIPYAEFLWTRFLGATIEVEVQDFDWADFAIAGEPELLKVTHARPELLPVHGGGVVAVTPYFVRRYVERFDRDPTRAWRELKLLLAHPSMTAVKVRRRRALDDVKHRSVGQHYLLPKIPKKNKKDKSLPRQEIVVVLAAVGRRAASETLTIYPATESLLKRLTPVQGA